MSQNKRYAYVTIDDFHSMGKDMRDQTLLAIKAPADTLLEVPRSDDQKVRIYCSQILLSTINFWYDLMWKCIEASENFDLSFRVSVFLKKFLKSRLSCADFSLEFIDRSIGQKSIFSLSIIQNHFWIEMNFEFWKNHIICWYPCFHMRYINSFVTKPFSP